MIRLDPRLTLMRVYAFLTVFTSLFSPRASAHPRLDGAICLRKPVAGPPPTCLPFKAVIKTRARDGRRALHMPWAVLDGDEIQRIGQIGHCQCSGKILQQRAIASMILLEDRTVS